MSLFRQILRAVGILPRNDVLTFDMPADLMSELSPGDGLVQYCGVFFFTWDGVDEYFTTKKVLIPNWKACSGVLVRRQKIELCSLYLNGRKRAQGLQKQPMRPIAFWSAVRAKLASMPIEKSSLAYRHIYRPTGRYYIDFLLYLW